MLQLAAILQQRQRSAPPPSAGGGSITSLTITSAATSGTYPVTFGHEFKKGDVPSNFTTDLPNYRVTVLSTWNDGSVKHARVDGRAALTQNVALTVNLSTGTPPSSGTALTASDIAGAGIGTCSIQCGALGTVTFSGSFGSPFRTLVSNAEVVECHYRGDVGSSGLSAWLYVRLYANSQVAFWPFVENGYLDNGSGSLASNVDRSYVPTVILNGSTVYNNSGSAIAHGNTSRWTLPQLDWAWTGTAPQIIPGHNATYLRGSKVVPPYGYTSPSGTALNAIVQTYSVLGQGPLPTSMGDTGSQPQIGLFPDWEALFCTSGDARAYKGVIAGALALNSYSIVRRDKTTNLPIKPSSFTNWGTTGPADGGEYQLTTNGLTWDSAHHGSGGFLAYLLTANYYFLETLGFQASLCYLGNGTTGGSGTSRQMLQQTRAAAWCTRTVGQYAAILPDAEKSAGQVGADYRTLLSNNYTANLALLNDGGSMRWSGCFYIYGYDLWNYPASGSLIGSIPPWMVDFFVATSGYLSDIEPLATMTTLIAVRDQQYRWPVGRAGITGAYQDFPTVWAGAMYGMKVSYGSGAGTDATWYQDWGAIYAQTFGGNANTINSNTLLGSSGGDPANMGNDGYWGILNAALSYAVEHGATGAGDAYLRLTGATNWASNAAANFNDSPKNGLIPRVSAVAWSPSYSLPSTTNTSTLIGSNTLDVNPPRPSGYTSGNFDASQFDSYAGGTFIKKYSKAGAYVKGPTGGHTNPSMLETSIFDFETGAWIIQLNGNGLSASSSSFTVSQTNGGNFFEVNGASPSQYPAPGHMYNRFVASENGPNGRLLLVGRDFVTSDGTANLSCVHQQPLGGSSAGVWSRDSSSVASGQQYGVGTSVLDPLTQRVYYINRPAMDSQSFLEYYDLTTKTYGSTPTYSGAAIPGGTGWGSAFIYDAGRMMVYHGDSGLFKGLNLNSIASGWVTLNTNTSAPFGDANTWVWHPVNKKFYSVMDDTSTNMLNVVTPPSSTPMTSQWTFSTVAIGGSGRSAYQYFDSGANNRHYSQLQYNPVLNCLAWVTGPGQVALIKV